MKSAKANDTRLLLKEKLTGLDLEPNDQILDRLSLYCDELLHWGQRTNLTGADTKDGFIGGPLFDALTLLPLLKDHPTFVDVGSGAGLPGLPLALFFPEIELTLVEPRMKRVFFLRHIIHRLQLSIEVIHGRIETVTPRKWHGAVAQAVWPPVAWLKQASTLVETDGAAYLLSAAALKPETIPEAFTLEESRTFVRPVDQIRRFASRLRRV